MAARDRRRRPEAPPAATAASIDDALPEDRYLNRELSWLDFNARVLALAADTVAAVAGAGQVPGDLRVQPRRVLHGPGRRPEAARRDGPVRALRRRSDTARATAPDRRADPADRQPARAGLPRLGAARRWPRKASTSSRGPIWTRLNATSCPTYFHEQVFPVLTPLAVDPAHPFPFVSGLSLNLAVTVKQPEDGGQHFARVKVPDNVDRFVELGARDGARASARA